MKFTPNAFSENDPQRESHPKTGIERVTAEVKETVDLILKKQKEMQTQVDAMDQNTKDRAVQFPARESLVEKLKANDGFNRLIADHNGRATLTLKDRDIALLERKTTITEVGQGFMTTGVMPIERIPGITAEARQVLTVRDVLSASPTTMAVVDFVKVLTPMSIASPVPEASLKPENQLSFASLSEKIRTLATWIPASKQVLDDFSELSNFISNSISYYVGLAEELQLLSGDGTGENLHGLIPQATPFVAGSLPGGSTRIDAIGAAIGQITASKELPPTFVVLHPADWWGMRLLKNTLGQYILGDPQTVVSPSLFGLTVVSTTSIAVGTFLVGSGNPAAAEIRDRMEMQVEVSTEHQDYFVKNLVAIRAEKRLALVVKRPASFVTGSFAGLGTSSLTSPGATSPAASSPTSRG